MSQNNTNSELRMNDDTTPEDVLSFVVDRVRHPVIIDDVVVFNFNNQSLDAARLNEWADDAEPGVYVMPYQISGVWAFINAVLPEPIRHGRLLAYRKSQDRYVDYDNWFAIYDQGWPWGVSPELLDLKEAIGDEAAEVVPDDV